MNFLMLQCTGRVHTIISAEK